MKPTQEQMRVAVAEACPNLFGFTAQQSKARGRSDPRTREGQEEWIIRRLTIRPVITD